MRVNGRALLGLLALGLGLGAAPASATTRCVNKTATGGCFGNIQAAVDASGPGDTVTIGAGTYYGTGNAGNLGPTNPTVYVGYGKDTLKIIGSGAVILDPEFKTGSTYDAIDVYSSFVSISNLTIRNGRSYGIYSYYNTGLNLSNVKISGTDGDCVYLDYSDFATIKGLKCTASGGSGIYANYSDFLTATANTLSQTYYGVYGYASNSPNITANTIQNPYYEGIEFYGPCCVAQAFGGTIKNNKILDDYYEGVYIYYQNGVTISGNKITNTDDPGIYVYGDNPIVAGNTIVNPYSYGIEVQGAAAQIKSNTIVNPDGSGIYLSSGPTDADSGVIALNKIRGYPGGDGIENYGNHVTIVSNTIANVYYGIYTDDGQPRVSSNTITNTQATGVYVYANTCYGGVVQLNTVNNVGDGSDGFDVYCYNAYGPIQLLSNTVNRANYHCFYLYGYTNGSNPTSINAVGNKGYDCGEYSRYGDGFSLNSGSTASGLKLTNNVIQRVAGDGYAIYAPGAVLTGNSSDSATEDGFDVHTGSVTLKNNKATNNTGVGFEFNYNDDYLAATLDGSTLVLTGNVASANAIGACIASSMTSPPSGSGNSFGTPAIPAQCSEAEGYIGN